MARRRRRAAHRTTWASEAALCTAFISAAETAGWTVYPETDGWDIVLARVDGAGELVTVGIQAKLRKSVKVLAQAIRPSARAPTHRAVLVPESDRDFNRVCSALGVGVYAGIETTAVYPVIQARGTKTVGLKPLVLPSVAGVGSAGTPAPERLTPWRERAIVLSHMLRISGQITGYDFDALKVKRAFWLESGWIIRAPKPGDWYRDPADESTRKARYITADNVGDQLPDRRYDTATRTAVVSAWFNKESSLKRRLGHYLSDVSDKSQGDDKT